MDHPIAAWDPGQYLRFAGDRARPFADLMARVAVRDVRSVVDLGCGPGNLTAALAARWPDAEVTGVDSSAEMIAAAEADRPPGTPARLRYVLADLRTWEPPAPVSVLVSNATLHWVPGHVELLGRFAGWLDEGGALAVQVPANFDQPTHAEITALRRSPRWRDRLGAALPAGEPASAEPETYLDALARLELRVDAWSTTYCHVLTGPDSVLEWVKGSVLRPVLARLGDDEQDQFCTELGARLRAAYPPAPYGTVLPFRRVFVVAHRP
ncbi:MAG: methyltransferase domain-containing protein [Frankiaceae bacterium]